MTEAGEPVALLENVWHRYGKQAALRGVSLELRAGGMLGLIGPDGVGKSTLLAILSGAKRVQAGPAGTNRIQVFGSDFTRARHRSAVCARIAYMPQGLGRNLYPDLTVRENIAFFSRLFGQGTAERAQRTDGLLTATGLAPFADRPAGKLSGGMRQKLGLCCALIHDPDLLILDEPTTGVDPLSRRQFWDLVDRIRAARPEMSVIVATAYMEEADRFGQLVAMNDGLVLATGSPVELRQRTGCDTLDESFIALLPAALRAARIRPDIPPLGARAAEDAITAVGLTRRFGSFTAVDDVSFRIGRGEIFGFLGSNGCGKTTTMRMLTGLLPISAGQALLFDRVVDAADISMRYRVGYMSQVFSLYTELTVRQNLVLHARPYHIESAKAGVRIRELVAAFIACLEAANGTEAIAAAPALAAAPRPSRRLFSLQRMLAYALRETIELRRDPVRLSFALFGMAFLMIVVGYGTNTDVDHLPFAVFDQDQTPESRAYVEAYRGSIYFKEQPPIAGAEQFQQRLTNGELMLVLDIPAGFGRAVRRGSPAAVGAWIDGAMPFRAETTRGYVQGAQSVYLTRLATEKGHDAAGATQPTVETRFRYNQDFDSVNSQVPSTIALLLALVPAILMALAVVREKEFGSITNLYVTPVTRLEFILGKQIPYVVLAMAGFAVVAVIAWLLFAVPVKGSLLALGVGTLVYVCATTAYGLLISAFASTQIAALFATAMLTVIPATQFSGMLSPVSSLSGTAAVISDLFPMSYYLPIVVGTFTKSLGFTELSGPMLLLALFIPALLVVSLFMLRKQER